MADSDYFVISSYIDEKGTLDQFDSSVNTLQLFIENQYIDKSGKENKCYNVTKLGCDFLANKFTIMIKEFHTLYEIAYI